MNCARSSTKQRIDRDPCTYGKSKSTTGILRYQFTQPGERELIVTTRDAAGGVLNISKRMLLVR